MKRIVLAITLVCVFVGTGLAGDIPGVPAPPPPGPSATEGDMGAGGFTETIADEFVLAVFGFFAS